MLQRTCTTVEPEDVLNKLSGSKLFSKIDLKNAYLQIPLDEESTKLTTINTPFGLFRYRFLPFGLSVSPAIFQQVMNNIVCGINGVEVYQDDIIVHGSSKVSHDDTLHKLFRRFFKYNVAVNPQKCSFTVPNFECLGYIVDGNGFKPDPNRLTPLTNAPSPHTMTELRSLVGALQYYARFIPQFSDKASCLFEILSNDSFEWKLEHENCLRSLLEFLKSDAILKPFSPNLPSTLITDALPIGIGAVSEQGGKPVICVSRKLTSAERGYSQTHREALAVYWAIKRLHKYLFGIKFTIITDHEALQFVYSPTKSLSRSSAAMVQRWCIALSAYDYSIIHRGAKHIQHVDYISRSTVFEDKNNSDCLLVQPLPVHRQMLIDDTLTYFAPLLSALKRGWNGNSKRKYPVYFSRREELSITPDGILCLNDRIVIPPKHRKAVLDDLHSGHLGIDKMKSLARLTCWWPEIDSDICRTANSCLNCQHKIRNLPSKWVPWPLSTESWQRVHADYCGPFLKHYYALVVIDSFSKWPDVFFTTSPTAEFSQSALRKLFSREGVPNVLVTDNGTHFTADALNDWLKGIGCKHLFTALRNPCSNGQAENFVKTLKSAITSFNPSSFKELERGVDNFLLQYRNSSHSTTGDSPAKLSKGRSLRSNMLCVQSAEIQYYRGNNLRPSVGIVLQNLGKRMVRILDMDDLSVHNRHTDQLRYQDSGQFVPNLPVLADTNNTITDYPNESTMNNAVRRSERIHNQPSRDYRNPEFHSSCGGCDNCI